VTFIFMPLAMILSCHAELKDGKIARQTAVQVWDE